jgi:hypothetical protein
LVPVVVVAGTVVVEAGAVVAVVGAVVAVVGAVVAVVPLDWAAWRTAITVVPGGLGSFVFSGAKAMVMSMLLPSFKEEGSPVSETESFDSRVGQ